jgi:hypothetical protein
MRQEIKIQNGTISITQNGKTEEITVPLKIIETYHDDGSKDCTIQVPPLNTKASYQEKRS